MKILWEATRDLHHACEKHPVGAAMASGTPPAEWYVDWLGALEVIHRVVDPDLCYTIRRTERLGADILRMGIEPLNLQSTQNYAAVLQADSMSRAGAAYVLTGAHLMGGEIMRRRLDGYPTRHLEWDDRKAALVELGLLRDRPDIVEAARACFAALLAAMDEIYARRKPV